MASNLITLPHFPYVPQGVFTLDNSFPPVQLLVIRTQMAILAHGLARVMSTPRPEHLIDIQNLRRLMLEHDFFKRDHKPEELRPRIRRSCMNWGDLVVLLARLARTLVQREPLPEAEMAERIAIRNAVLDQPFFNLIGVNAPRTHVGERERWTDNPFVDSELFNDEGCEM